MLPLRALRSRLFAALAVLVLVAGTAAPALARMTCVMSGRSVVGLGTATGCCPAQEDAAPTVKAQCCEVSKAEPQRTAFVPVPAPALPPLAVTVVPVALVPVPAAEDGAFRNAPCSRPPPDTGRRLAVMGTLLI